MLFRGDAQIGHGEGFAGEHHPERSRRGSERRQLTLGWGIDVESAQGVSSFTRQEQKRKQPCQQVRASSVVYAEQ
ncbi:MAG: hypothetical protein KF916_05610 [Microbacteriaceae bacterium]|nr:hypothetical protein [Microbacteriaceae bacterium]